MNSTRSAVLALFASSFIVGCAVDTGTETAGSASEALLAQAPDSPSAAATLQGTWVAESGVMLKLELTEEPAQTVGGICGKKFKAVVDTGIRCITTPCPSQADVSGVYTASSKKLSLIAIDKPGQTLQKVLGDYRYEVSKGVLSLRKTGAGNESVTFQRPVVMPPAVASCVTYKSADSTSLGGAFYAINVPSKEAGEALLADRADGIVEGNVAEGACNAPRLCPFIYLPVCRREPGQGPEQYGNVCQFEAAVRSEAGDGEGGKTESKGRWTDGACFAQGG